MIILETLLPCYPEQARSAPERERKVSVCSVVCLEGMSILSTYRQRWGYFVVLKMTNKAWVSYTW